jgi:hypothetical protein
LSHYQITQRTSKSCSKIAIEIMIILCGFFMLYKVLSKGYKWKNLITWYMLLLGIVFNINNFAIVSTLICYLANQRNPTTCVGFCNAIGNRCKLYPEGFFLLLYAIIYVVCSLIDNFMSKRTDRIEP